jgi:hypothetical protein
MSSEIQWDGEQSYGDFLRGLTPEQRVRCVFRDYDQMVRTKGGRGLDALSWTQAREG